MLNITGWNNGEAYNSFSNTLNLESQNVMVETVYHIINWQCDFFSMSFQKPGNSYSFNRQLNYEAMLMTSLKWGRNCFEIVKTKCRMYVRCCVTLLYSENCVILSFFNYILFFKTTCKVPVTYILFITWMTAIPLLRTFLIFHMTASSWPRNYNYQSAALTNYDYKCITVNHLYHDYYTMTDVNITVTTSAKKLSNFSMTFANIFVLF